MALFIVQNLKEILQWIQNYDDAPFLGPKWSIYLKLNFFSGNLLMNHENFDITQIPGKTNGMIFLKSSITMFLGLFWTFLPDGDFFWKIQRCHTQLSMNS